MSRCNKFHLGRLAGKIVVCILNVDCDDDDLHTTAHRNLVQYLEPMHVEFHASRNADTELLWGYLFLHGWGGNSTQRFTPCARVTVLSLDGSSIRNLARDWFVLVERSEKTTSKQCSQPRG